MGWLSECCGRLDARWCFAVSVERGVLPVRGTEEDDRTRAQMILEGDDPPVDAGAVDSAGLTVLHRVAQALDHPYLAMLLEERQKSQGVSKG